MDSLPPAFVSGGFETTSAMVAVVLAFAYRFAAELAVLAWVFALAARLGVYAHRLRKTAKENKKLPEGERLERPYLRPHKEVKALRLQLEAAKEQHQAALALAQDNDRKLREAVAAKEAALRRIDALEAAPRTEQPATKSAAVTVGDQMRAMLGRLERIERAVGPPPERPVSDELIDAIAAVAVLQAKRRQHLEDEGKEAAKLDAVLVSAMSMLKKEAGGVGILDNEELSGKVKAAIEAVESAKLQPPSAPEDSPPEEPKPSPPSGFGGSGSGFGGGAF